MNLQTKKYRTASIICTVLNSLCVIVPILVYAIMAFAVATTESKVVLGIVGTCGLIFGLLGIINKKHYGFIPLLLLLGIYAALNSIVDVIIVFAATGMVSDLILTPLQVHYTNLYNINKQIDNRL